MVLYGAKKKIEIVKMINSRFLIFCKKALINNLEYF